jgi:DNA-binding IclR family transcriptional regulator
MPKKKRRIGDSRKKVLEALKDAKASLTPKQIASRTRLNRNSVRRLAQELFKEGAVSKPDRGLYQAQ